MFYFVVLVCRYQKNTTDYIPFKNLFQKGSLTTTKKK